MYPNLPHPFFVLAPMYDVTDTVFRQVVAGLAAPDLFMTEFVNADALNSAGREHSMKHLQFTAHEKPIIAQIWGANPDNYREAARALVRAGFAGIDINMGCPAKTIMNRGCCGALCRNRHLALAIISATIEGADGQ